MRLTQRKLVLFSLFLGLLAASSAGAQPFEVEFFERPSDPNNFGQPLFLPDVNAWAAVTGGGTFDNGTAVAKGGCCGSTFTLNTIIGLSTDPNAITEGTQALNISMTNNNPGNQGAGNTAFDRPAVLTITPADPRYVGLQAVAANPSNFSMNFDITLIASEVPDTFSTDALTPNPFITIGFFQDSGGFGFVEPPSIRDFTTWDATQLSDMEAAGHDTRSLSFSATELQLPLAPSSYQIGFVFNGNWQLTQRAGFNIDNWRFEAAFTIADLDLDLDLDVDAADFEILMANHLDPNANTFAEGDLDGDGDNDFADFRRFEDGWSVLGAPVPFSALLAGEVPEPATVGLFALGGVAILMIRRRRASAVPVVLIAVVLAFTGQQAKAQLANTLLFDWETGLQGWEVAPDAVDPNTTVLGNSAIGSTQVGTQSMSVRQALDGFSWNATNSIFGNANFDALESALDIGAEHFVIEMDVTYDVPGSIPAGFTFANTSLRIQSSAGTSEVGGLANFDPNAPSPTISISQALSSWTALPGQGGETGFFRFDIGMNGDWGFTPGTFYFDNLRLRQVSAPAVLTLEVDRSNGSTRILNNSGVDGTGPGGTGGPVDFNYYQITSFSQADTEPDGDVDGIDFLDLQINDPNSIAVWDADYGLQGGSLSTVGWSSLDAQNIDAVDGPDPGTIAGDSTFEGWTAAGGVDTALSESFFLSSSQLADTAFHSLGTPFSVGGAENLRFLYREPGRPDFLREGNVVYVGVAPLSGATAVPEASTALLALVGGIVSLMTKRRKSPSAIVC